MTTDDKLLTLARTIAREMRLGDQEAMGVADTLDKWASRITPEERACLFEVLYNWWYDGIVITKENVYATWAATKRWTGAGR